MFEMVLKDFDMVFEPNRKKNAASKRNSKTQQQNTTGTYLNHETA
jgi:hypothetical protein